MIAVQVGALAIVYPDCLAYRHALPPLRWLRPHQPVSGWIAISDMYRQGSRVRSPDDSPCDRARYLWAETGEDGDRWLDRYVPVQVLAGGAIRRSFMPWPSCDRSATGPNPRRITDRGWTASVQEVATASFRSEPVFLRLCSCARAFEGVEVA